MTRARASLISLDDTPWYHLVNRCVRRAYLCGLDKDTGKDLSHRKEWIEARIRQLGSVFAIDVAAYAVMSNHYHVVVRVDRERAEAWSTREVLEIWSQLFKGPLLVQEYLAGKALSPAQLAAVDTLAAQYRTRLHDISWFMRVLNESIARMANAEDGVKGRFWEGRFKSQALLDEQAILTVMSYVDLNPIRAGMAETPETSEHTSIQARLTQRDGVQAPPESLSLSEGQNSAGMVENETMQATAAIDALPMAALLPFGPQHAQPRAVPFAFVDYIEWLDYIGRAIHPHKRGAIPAELPKIAVRLNIDARNFVAQSQGLLAHFGQAVGIAKHLKAHGASHRLRHLHGMREARQLFGVVCSSDAPTREK